MRTVDSEGDRVLHLYLGEVSDAAQGMLTADQRALLLAELRRRIERDWEEIAAAGDAKMRELIRRYGEPYRVVGDEAYLRPIEESLPDLEPAAVYASDAGGGPAGGPATIPAQGGRSVPQIPVDDDYRPPEAPVPAGPDAEVWDDDDGYVPEEDRGDPGAAGDRVFQFVKANSREMIALFAFLVSAVFSQLLFLIAAYIIVYFSGKDGWSPRERRFAVLWIPAFSIVLFVVEVWLYGSGKWGGVQLQGSSLGHEVSTLFYTLTRTVALLALVYLFWRLLRKRLGAKS